MKKYIFIKARTSLIISFLTSVAVMILLILENQASRKCEYLQDNLASIRKVALKAQNATSLINAHEPEFAAFEACSFEHSQNDHGLKVDPTYTVEYGHTSTVLNDSKGQNVISQDVTFTIPCLKDSEIFNFIVRLVSHGPGIFQIQELTITRMSSLSEEMLHKIMAGEKVVLFQGKIKTTWIHR
jgi:hypothetical protein